MHCPRCLSSKVKKNGLTHYGKQNHKCNSCGRQFVADSTHLIQDSTRRLINNALLERVSLRGICRIFGVSLTWLLAYATHVWESTPADLGAQPVESLQQEDEMQLQCTGIQLDELWSFVGRKRCKAWIWIAYEPINKQVVAVVIGKRDEQTFNQLWESIPSAWRKFCPFDTDDYAVYAKYIPEQHHYVGKQITYWIEAFNGRIRSRVSRLVRDSSFNCVWVISII